jgi:DNA-directed RNA polymerase subunit RPC12/RpoP
MNTEVQPQFNRVIVKRKRGNAIGALGKVTLISMGATGMFFGALLCLTIIGIIPGILMMFGGFGMIMLAQGRQEVKCPSCKKRNYPTRRADAFDCDRCKSRVLVDWT